MVAEVVVVIVVVVIVVLVVFVDVEIEEAVLFGVVMTSELKLEFRVEPAAGELLTVERVLIELPIVVLSVLPLTVEVVWFTELVAVPPLFTAVVVVAALVSFEAEVEAALVVAVDVALVEAVKE